MAVLPDHEITWLSTEAKEPLISPYEPGQLQPASYDTLLDQKLLVPREGQDEVIDLRSDHPVRMVEYSFEEDLGFLLKPHHFVLGSTVERVDISNRLVGRIEGKSSLARAGLQIHSAGYLDPGFRGNVTLEIVNLSLRPIVLYARMRIAQLSFNWLSSTCRRPYGSPGLGSHYQDARGVEDARYGEDGS